MKRFYLIPAEVVYDEFNQGNVRKPKYLRSLKVNWAGAFIRKKDVYVAKVATKFPEELTKLESHGDVVLLDGSQKAKNKVGTFLSKGVVGDEVRVLLAFQSEKLKKEEIDVME